MPELDLYAEEASDIVGWEARVFAHQRLWAVPPKRTVEELKALIDGLLGVAPGTPWEDADMTRADIRDTAIFLAFMALLFATPALDIVAGMIATLLERTN